MTNLDILVSGVEYTSAAKREDEIHKFEEAKKTTVENPSIGLIQNTINDYSTNCLMAVCFVDPEEWRRGYTSQNGLRENMLSLKLGDIKHEMLKYAVNLSLYNAGGASYLGTDIDNLDALTDNWVMDAICNNVRVGNIETVYSWLDNPDVMRRCLRSFVSTVNEPQKKDQVFNVYKTNAVANELVHSLDVYYARWVNVGEQSYKGK